MLGEISRDKGRTTVLSSKSTKLICGRMDAAVYTAVYITIDIHYHYY